MNAKHTFNLEELKAFLKVKCLKSKQFDSDYAYINDLFDASLSWDIKLVSLNHIFSIVLEQFEKRGSVNNLQVIDFLYELQNKYNFNVQEGDIYYLEKLFINSASTNLSLEEELIEIENQLY